jgi:RNA polymerase sigma-70 factor (ECF subfamily)
LIPARTSANPVTGYLWMAVHLSRERRFFVVKATRFAILRAVTKPIPGTLQEGGAPFQTTHWTVVLRVRETQSDGSAQRALSDSCEAYWPPLYTFVRRRGYSPSDAQDLVQDFFVHLFKQNTLSRADREKGRLRTFLLTSLENFLRKQWNRVHTIKRGGKQQMVSFDLLLPNAEAAMQANAHLSDVISYDVTWASNVVTRAWKNLRQTFAAEGKHQWIDELKPFIAGGTTALPNQEGVAQRLGVRIATFRVWLTRLRQRYRDALRAEVASTVSDPTDVDDELQYLYRILTS